MKININLEEILLKTDDIKDLIARLKFELKDAEKQLEKEELKLEDFLKQTGVDYCDHGVYSFGYKESSRTVFNQKLFGEKHPELLEEFKTTSTIKKFEFKINN